jgi:exosortase/archaeosortase family protein
VNGEIGTPKNGPSPSSKYPSNSQRASSSLLIFTQRFGLEIRIAIIAISSIVIFYQDLYVIGSDALASSYYNYVLVIPFLSAYLIYRKRRLLSAVVLLREDKERSKTNLVIGISSLVVALITYLYGSGTTYSLDYHILSILVFVGASILLLFNRRTLWLLSPSLLLFIAALPSLTQFGLSFWLAMSWLSIIPAQWILAQLIGLNVIITLPSQNIPTLFLTTASGSTYSFAVGVASSGVYSVVGFTLFAAFLGYISKGALWKKVLLFVLGYPLLIVINILREVILVSVANIWGDFAFNVFHATSGIVLVFIAVFFMLVIGDRVLKLDFFGTTGTQPKIKERSQCTLCAGQEYNQSHNFCANCGRFIHSLSRKFSSRDFFALATILIISIIFVATLAPAVAVASAPTKVPIQSISGSNADSLLPQVQGWNLSFVERDTFVQDALEQDAVLVYNYVQNTTTHPVNLYVTIQVAAGGMHTPEASLVVYPVLFGRPGVQTLTDGDIQILSQPYLVGTFFVYNEAGSTEAYIYWITRAAFNFGSYYDFRNVEISIWQNTSLLASSGVIPSATNLTAIKQLFLPLTQAIAKFWQPASSNSIIQTIVQRWSILFAGLAIFPALLVAGRDLDKQRSRKASVRLALKSLSNKNKALLNSISEAYKPIVGESFFLLFGGKGRKKIPPTLEQILSVYNTKKPPREQISMVDALKELTYLEHIGLVKRDIQIDKNDDAPIEVWKLTF